MTSKKNRANQAALPGTDEVEAATEAELIGSFMHRMGFDQLPARAVLSVPVDRIIIPRAATLDKPHVNNLAVSIGVSGFIQIPAVAYEQGSPLDVTSPDVWLRVVYGRHRVAGGIQAAREKGFAHVDLYVYNAVCSPRLRAAIAFIEDLQRQDAWRNQVANAREILQEGEGLTEDEVILRLGLKRQAVRQRMKIARLPGPLVDLIVNGKQVGQDMALKMTNLDGAHQQKLAAWVAGGRPLTAETVNEAWLDQINGGMAQTAPTFLNVLDAVVAAAQGEPHAGCAKGDDSSGASPLLARLGEVLAALERYPMPSMRRSLFELFQQEMLRWGQELDASSGKERNG